MKHFLLMAEVSLLKFHQMDLCCQPTSHYLNQCWHIIKVVLWHSAERNFTRSSHEFNLYHVFSDHTFKITITSARVLWSPDLMLGEGWLMGFSWCWLIGVILHASEVEFAFGKNHDDIIKWKHFSLTGHLCGEFTGLRWIPHTKASDAETGEFPTQRPVTRSFDVFFDLRLGERLSKHSWSWWLEKPSRPLWHQSNYNRTQCPISIWRCLTSKGNLIVEIRLS